MSKQNKRLKTIVFLLLLTSLKMVAQDLPTDGPLTIRPLLQQLGNKLLKGKKGSIVAIRPQTGEVICLATNSPEGYNLNLAVATPYAPGSTFKTAQALTLLSEGIITPEMTIPCTNGFTDGNIHVGCHQHASPLNLQRALAISCNTWFLMTFMQMINESRGKGDGKEIEYTGMVMMPDKFPKGYFVPGRMAMTCCANDMSFLGYACKSVQGKSFPERTWVRVRARVSYENFSEYEGEGIVLYAESVEETKQPKEPVINFAG